MVRLNRILSLQAVTKICLGSRGRIRSPPSSSPRWEESRGHVERARGIGEIVKAVFCEIASVTRMEWRSPHIWCIWRSSTTNFKLSHRNIKKKLNDIRYNRDLRQQGRNWIILKFFINFQVSEQAHRKFSKKQIRIYQTVCKNRLNHACVTLISDYYQKPNACPWPIDFFFSFMNWYTSFTSKHFEASRSVYYALRTIYKTNQFLIVYTTPNRKQLSHNDSQ